jgi:putative Holliday junction resolvase
MPRLTPPESALSVPVAPRPTSDTAPQLVIAFDFGRRRIGVACGDTVSRTARPLAAIANGPDGPRWDEVAAQLREWRPALLVVGLPYNVDGTESDMSSAARRFAAELEARHVLAVRLIDERYSSLEAQARLREERESGQRRRRVAKDDVDAAAACIILERWFLEST